MEPIPGPPGLPFLGNLGDISAENPMQSFVRNSDIFGPIWKFHLAGERIVIASQALMDEVSDEERFSKIIAASLNEVRNGTHDGLFTARGPEEKNWGIAHRVLLPALGPLAIKNMFDEMHDIASQLVMKWARQGPEQLIQVTDDFTRLTLDTIALCAMDYRFNSYYSEHMHPFIQAMTDFLKVSGDRARRDPITQMFYRSETAQYWDNVQLLRKVSQEVINKRKQNPTQKKDLLNGMLNGVDPKTGETMNEESIIDNMITFLIAGHETTSGLLSFTFYYLLKSPSAYEKAQKEVDEVIGKDPITVDHLTKLPYLNAILRESIRLQPTAPAIGLQAKEDTTLGGKYECKKGVPIVAVLPKVHRDPLVWGEDAEEFRPERMLDEEFERRNNKFPNCWKPFGNGMRACIGRPFAWQEALLVLAILLQNFNFTMEDPSYQLEIKQTLTIKPKGFYMRAHLRNHMSPTTLERALASTSISEHAGEKKAQGTKKKAAQGKPIAVYYGSNTGTCEALATRLASDAPNHGFSAVVDTLDAVKENMPKDRPIAIITASYEGQPADNAAHFVTWLNSLTGSELTDVQYTVFGCGHRDWAATFHKVPKAVDRTIEERGGTRIADIGTADTSKGDIFTEFEAWEEKVFWPAVKDRYGASDSSEFTPFEANLEIEVSTPRSSMLRQDVREARVEAVEVLSAPNTPEKRHIEISLPSGTSYSAGDYLTILPMNPKENIARAMRYFGLAWDSMLTITSSSPTTLLPVGVPISATDIFGTYIELSLPATKRDITALVEVASDKAAKNELIRLATDTFNTEITEKRVSVLDLLERFPSVCLPLGPFLKMLPPMRVRQYSISSSPLWNPTNVTLTYGVVDELAYSGQGRFVGVASNYLSSLAVGDKLHVAVRSSHQAFHLPKDAKNVPVIMIAAGTGLAPFRGFIQERAAQIAAGRTLAPALLFYGCRDPSNDLLYSDLLSRWEKLGAVSLRYAFSRAPSSSEGCKYVQDRIYHDCEEVVKLFDAGAKLFVCGSSEVGKGVKDVCLKIAREERVKKMGGDVDEGRLTEWFEGLRNERFATDVFT